MSADIDLEYAEERRKNRIDRSMSLRDEAARMGISAEELSDMEHGRKPFPIEHIRDRLMREGTTKQAKAAIGRKTRWT